MMTKPMSMLLMMLAGWINRRQQEAIEYLREENKILREKLGPKRILLNDSQRRRLAILGEESGGSTALGDNIAHRKIKAYRRTSPIQSRTLQRFIRRF